MAEIDEDKFGLDRIVFFSDAVIAIAITLLVIELGVPDISSDRVDDVLWDRLREMRPELLGVVVSFWVIGFYWAAHHRMFRKIQSYDRALLNVNLVVLMFIVFMPFATNLLFTYPARRVSVIVYAFLVSAIGMSLYWMWAHAAKEHRLVSPQLAPSAMSAVSRALLVTPAVFLASAVIALFNPALAMYSWMILIPFHLTPIGRRLVTGADG